MNMLGDNKNSIRLLTPTLTFTYELTLNKERLRIRRIITSYS